MASWAETAAAAALDGGADYSKAASETLSDASDTLQKYIDNTNTAFRNGMTDINSLFTNINDGMTNWAKADELNAQRQGIANQIARDEAEDKVMRGFTNGEILDSNGALGESNSNVYKLLNGMSPGEHFAKTVEQAQEKSKQAQKQQIKDAFPNADKTPEQVMMETLGINTVQNSLWTKTFIKDIVTPANNEVTSANSIIDAHSVGLLSQGSYNNLSSENPGKIDQNTGKSWSVLLADEQAKLGLGPDDSPLKSMPQDQIVKYATNMKEAQIAKDNGWITLGQYLALGKLSANKEFIDAANKVVEIEARQMDQLNGYIHDERTAYMLADILISEDVNGIYKGMTRSQLADTLYNKSLAKKQARMQSQFAIASNQEGMDVIKRPVAQGNGAPTNNNNQQGGQQRTDGGQQGTDGGQSTTVTNQQGSQQQTNNSSVTTSTKNNTQNIYSGENTRSQNSRYAMTSISESNGNPFSIGKIPNDPGKKSYGLYQINQNTMVDYLKNSPFGSLFDGLEIGTPEFDAKWEEVTRTEGKNFIEDQERYLDRTHFNPAKEALKEFGLDIENSPELESAVASFAISRGGKGAAKFIKEALLAKDIDPKTASDETIIKAIYDYEYDNVEQSYKSTPAAWDGRRERARREQKHLIEQINKNQYGSERDQSIRRRGLEVGRGVDENDLSMSAELSKQKFFSNFGSEQTGHFEYNIPTYKYTWDQSWYPGNTERTTPIQDLKGFEIKNDKTFKDTIADPLSKSDFCNKLDTAARGYNKASMTSSQNNLFEEFIKMPQNELEKTQNLIKKGLEYIDNKYGDGDMPEDAQKAKINLRFLEEQLSLVMDAKQNKSAVANLHPFSPDNENNRTKEVEAIIKERADLNKNINDTTSHARDSDTDEMMMKNGMTVERGQQRIGELSKNLETANNVTLFGMMNISPYKADKFTKGSNGTNPSATAMLTQGHQFARRFGGIQLNDANGKPIGIDNPDTNSVKSIIKTVMSGYINPDQIQEFYKTIDGLASLNNDDKYLKTLKGKDRKDAIDSITKEIQNLITKNNFENVNQGALPSENQQFEPIAKDIYSVILALTKEKDKKLSFMSVSEIREKAGITNEDDDSIALIKLSSYVNRYRPMYENPYNK